MAQKVTDIFERFDKHKDGLNLAVSRLEKYFTVFLRVLSCNADSACCFSDAWCESERSESVARFTDLFDIGVVTNFLDTGVLHGDNQKQRQLLWAFETLADFLDNYDEMNRILKHWIGKSVKENEWARLFGIHVAKKLSCSKLMTISDAGYEKISYCLCGCDEALHYGDTSMGNKNVWHGSVDILLGNVAVDITPSPKEVESDASGPDFELKTENLEKHRHQLLAETIVFGCTQRQQQHTLAPLIAVSVDDFKVFLYDFDSDLLFETEEFDLEPPVELDTILALWLVINHSLFGLGVSQEYCQFGFFAEFKTFIRDKKKLEIYDKEMNLGQCKRARKLLLPLKTFLDKKRRKNNIYIVDRERK